MLGLPHSFLELEVKKSKITCDGCLAEDIPRPLPSHSHTMLFVGQAGSGKTNLMVSILSQHKKKGKRCGMAKVIIVFAILKK